MYRFGSFLTSAMARLSPTVAEQDSETDAACTSIPSQPASGSSFQSVDNIVPSSSMSSANGMTDPVSSPLSAASGSSFRSVDSARELPDLAFFESHAKSALDEFLAGVDDAQKWSFLARDEDVNIYVYRPVGQTRECVKGEGVIRSDPSVLLDEIWDPEVKYRKQWDEMLSEAFIVEQLSDTLQISYTAFRSPTRIVSSRDFVVLRKLVLHDEGGDLSKGFTMVFKSIAFDHPVCTPKKDLVRGETLASGFLVTPLSDNPARDGFSVKCVLDVDVKGWLPDIVVNFFNAKQATVIAKIRNRCHQRSSAKQQQQEQQPQPVPM